MKDNNKIKKENIKTQKDSRNKILKRTAIVSVIVLIAIAIFVNLFLNTVVGDKLSFDWTPNKAQTLGDVSKDILKSTEKDVKITVLGEESIFQNRSSGADLSFMPSLLAEYEQFAGASLETQYIDPVANPSIINTIDPNNVHNLARGQIVVSNADYSKIKVLNMQDLLSLQSQQNQYYVTGYKAEESITNAVRLVSSDVTPVAYFTQGHGEADPSQQYTVLNMILEQNSYYIDSLDTRTASDIPEDAKLLIMLETKQDLSETEVKLYLDFLAKGNSLLVLNNYGTQEYPNLNKLLLEYDLQISTDRVMESNTDMIFPAYENAFLATIAKSNLYTQADKVANAVVIDAAAVGTANNSKEWIETESLLETSDQGILQIGGNPDNNETTPAVHSVAMYSKNKGFIDGSTVTEPAQVVVFGSAWAVNDANMMNFPGNYFLANDTINALNGEDETGGDLLIQPKPVVTYYLPARSQGTYQIFAFVFLALVPITLLVIALVTYRRRRKL